MPTIHSHVDEEVSDRIRTILGKQYKDLKDNGVKIGALYIEDEEDGHALFLHGYPKSAVVKIIPTKQRMHGSPDAEITIDRATWNKLTAKGRDSLIDHELHHVLIVREDKSGSIKKDYAGRPQLKLKMHDWELGGFADIAKRYGDDAIEVSNMKAFEKQYGQLVFGFAMAGAAA